MAGGVRPPGGFRWVEPSEQADEPRKRGRRWWWAVSAVVAVLALTGAGLWVWRSDPIDRHSDQAQPWTPPMGTPRDLLVSFGLDRQPVPGWRIGPTDVGLPEDAPLGFLFASREDKAFFLSEYVDNFCTRSCRPPRGWVYGIDTRTGARLFNPVELPAYTYGVTCYGNGPSVAVCVKNVAPSTVWVIDLDRGAVTFTGPTDIVDSGIFRGRPEAHAAGTHSGQTRLLATLNGQGIYGVGARGERTWFVPGNGFFKPMDYQVANDIPPPTLAAAIGSGHDPDRVFSTVDGTDVTPPAPTEGALNHAMVYSEGFVYSYRSTQTGETGVLFFDTKGRLLAHRRTGQSQVVLLDNPPMPAIQVNGMVQIYTVAGQPVTQFPAPDVVTDLRTIGTKIYVGLGEPSERRWQQRDLLTGEPGATCTGFDLHNTFPNGGYVASDGTTIVGRFGYRGEQFAAMNMTTCQMVWQTPDDLYVEIWKVGTGLLERDREHNTMVRLRPPA